jgi:hypothetical protein
MDQSYEEMRKVKFKLEVSLNLKSFIIFAYLVTNDGSFVTLSTFELFKNGCGSSSLEVLNQFDKTSSKWLKKLEFEEKFMDFNGCELVMLLPVQSDITFYYFGHAVVNSDNTDLTTHGLTPEIFKIAAEKFHFIAAFQPVEIYDRDFMIRRYPDNVVKFFELNGTVKTPSVIFDVLDIDSVLHKKKINQVFMSVKTELYSTPADDFTCYEKFLMIFDGTTLVLLDVVIFCILLTALIAHLVPKISHSALEISWNFSTIFRLSFTTFVSVCLIFVIFFQSKSFEFMTAEPRRQTPKTIQDLIDGNYTVIESDPKIYENIEINEW